MRAQWEECWRFETANLAVVFEVTDCDDDPAGHFASGSDEQDAEIVDKIREGHLTWFDCRVRVLLSDGGELGSDYLSACCYNSVREFYTMHRQYKQRDYFGDMVRQALGAAREKLATVRGIRLRAA